MFEQIVPIPRRDLKRRLALVRRLFLFMQLVALCASASAQVPTTEYQEALLRRAAELELSGSPVWETLLFYRPRLMLPGQMSLGDDPDFFLSSDGDTDPQAELAATIASFFEQGNEPDEHPQCRFPARYLWLKEQLQFDPIRLVERDCPAYQEWIAGLDPQSLTLIFPTAYLNNPASMFGHTLIRVNSSASLKGAPLLAYAVNYAAATNERSGVVFAVKGLLGGYRGSYAVEPYYRRVNKYSEIEHRDIWEYELSLSPVETRRALAFVWELGHVYFDYYFFDENCSYYLLALLEFARPSLELSSAFRFWAIPSDTVRVINKQPDLVEQIIYRPAAGTLLRAHFEQLSESERSLALALASGELTISVFQSGEYSGGTQVRILEAAFEYLSYQRSRKKANTPEDGVRAQSLLAARSKLTKSADWTPIVTPTVRPDQGHPTGRLSVGTGLEADRSFYEIEFRPAYHDLLDPQEGYPEGAEIAFFELAARQGEGSGFELERFHPVAIRSLSPRTGTFRKISWELTSGLWRERVDSFPGELVGGLEGGPGLSYALFKRTAQLYGLVDGSVKLSSAYDQTFAVGGGPKLGGLFDISQHLRLEAKAGVKRLALGDTHTIWAYGLSARYTLSDSLAVVAEFEREREHAEHWNTFQIAVRSYF